MINVTTRAIMLQYTNVSKKHVVHLKFTQCYTLNLFKNRKRQKFRNKCRGHILIYILSIYFSLPLLVNYVFSSFKLKENIHIFSREIKYFRNGEKIIWGFKTKDFARFFKVPNILRFKNILPYRIQCIYLVP